MRVVWKFLNKQYDPTQPLVHNGSLKAYDGDDRPIGFIIRRKYRSHETINTIFDTCLYGSDRSKDRSTGFSTQVEAVAWLESEYLKTIAPANRYPLYWIMKLTDSLTLYKYEGYIGHPMPGDPPTWIITLEGTTYPYNVAIECALPWIVEKNPPPTFFHSAGEAQRWCEAYTTLMTTTMVARNPAPHAAAPQHTNKTVTATYLQAIDEATEEYRSLKDFFRKVAVLATKWERNAEAMGVRTIDSNTHLLFRNEVEAVIPDGLRSFYTNLKATAKADHHEKEVQAEQARRRRAAKQEEKVQEQGDENLQGAEDPWEAEQGTGVLRHHYTRQVDPAE